jgi:DNA ligase-1
MRRFAEVCEAVAASTGKKEKVRLVAEYLRTQPVDVAAVGAIFFCGRAFARSEERVAAVGGSLLWEAVTKLAQVSTKRTQEIYRAHGDLGAVTEQIFRDRPAPSDPSPAEVRVAFDSLAAARGPAAKLAILEDLLGRADALTAKYIVKILTGELRIGLQESQVEDAIAVAFEQPAALVRRANMLTGDIGATLRLAAAGRLAEARLHVFRPVSCMLASPIDTASEAAEAFPGGALVEDKYDGVRAQAHKSGGRVRLFSRTLDEFVEFSELTAPLLTLPGEFVLDGEIVAWRDGRALPFTELQQRLGRKHPELWLPLEIPVSFVAFDVLLVDGEQLLDAPLTERRRRLETLLLHAPAPAVQLAPAAHCSSPDEFAQAFAAALARGNEGILMKAPDSVYAPGRRGRWWLKWKQPMATLDVVVTAVEYGHGKRHGLLSDYTFAVRGEKGLENIGKAYSGLTDEEIRNMTAYFLEHTIKDHGFRRTVEPVVVLEVAFNNIQRSTRHASGYALRFPRIVRLRPDKDAGEIDTVERVRSLFEKQSNSGAEVS